ncbi:MAG: ATP-binding protein [Patescibacteria group bacterium]
MREEKGWYVITGGPSSGKTTTVNILKARGYTTTIEHARHYIDTERVTGKSTEEIRANQVAFQRGVLEMQIREEKALPKDAVVFLDRALPDALAYYRFLGLSEDEKLREALKKSSYKRVFILDPLPLTPDYARTEDEVAQKKIHTLLVEVYQSLGFPIVRVPILAPEERVDFIVQNL